MSAKIELNKLQLEKLPDVMTLEEAGLYIGYTGEYLRKQSKAKKFPGFQLFEGKGCWRVKKEDLSRWLAERRGNMTEVFSA